MASAPVIVYTTPSCQGCRLTKANFDKGGVSYEMVDLLGLPDAEVEDLKARVGLQAPIVVVPNDPAYGALAGAEWSGMNPVNVAALTALAA